MLVIKNLPSCPWREQTLLSWLSHSASPRWWLTLCSALPVLPAGTSAASSWWDSLRSRQLPRGGKSKAWACEVVREAKQEGRFVSDPCFPGLDSEVSTEAPSPDLPWNWDQTTRA